MDACLDLFDEDVQREVASPFMTQVSKSIVDLVIMMMMIFMILTKTETMRMKQVNE